MSFPISRLRRLRRTPAIREMVRETRVEVSSLVAPLFIVPGAGVCKEVRSMPGQYQMSSDVAARKVAEVSDLGIRSVILFAIPETKDEVDSRWLAERGSPASEEIEMILGEMRVEMSSPPRPGTP